MLTLRDSPVGQSKESLLTLPLFRVTPSTGLWGGDDQTVKEGVLGGANRRSHPLPLRESDEELCQPDKSVNSHLRNNSTALVVWQKG